ncbi:MAG TPA: DUF1697 domain-containing protein [Chitinophagales bacterium]|nr:DUF1697 domain-containing protein [Chitinophagales bacterium]HRK28948.1 DUF1697 domain-containing protein [Chitinophagales bacterium]
MKNYLALLRGINVSGQKMIKMPALAAMFTQLGFTDVATYIQSGNVLFNSHVPDTNAINNSIKSAILDRFGFDVEIITLTSHLLAQAIAQNPFIKSGNTNTEKMYLTFLKETPNPDLAEKLLQTNYLPEEIQIINRWVYFYSPESYGRAKLNNNFIESKLKTAATTRNWKTILTLQTLLA